METLAALDARVSTTWLRKHLWRSIFIVLVLMYAAQLYSPLRISEDTVGFLSAAESGYRGEGLLYEGREMPNLSGYPVMIVGLLKLGLGHPWVLAGLNLLFLTAALWGVWTIARREYEMTEERTWKLLCLCLSSFVVLKHSTIPMSDIPFLGILMPCLVVMLRAEKETARRRWMYVGIAIGLVLLSLWTRRAGVALAMPLAMTIWAMVPSW